MRLSTFSDSSEFADLFPHKPEIDLKSLSFKEALRHFIRRFGGITKVSKQTGITRSSITHWLCESMSVYPTNKTADRVFAVLNLSQEERNELAEKLNEARKRQDYGRKHKPRDFS